MNQDEYQLLLSTIESYEIGIAQMREKLYAETDGLKLIGIAKDIQNMREILDNLLDAKKDYEVAA